MTISSNDFLTPDDLNREYGFSKSTQAKYRMARKIPFIKIGGRYIRYKREDIHRWLEDNRIEAV